MTTHINTVVTILGLSCTIDVEAGTAAEAVEQLRAAVNGADQAPNAQAASQPASTPAPTATQNAQPTPSAAGGAPQVGAGGSATETTTPSNPPAATPPAVGNATNTASEPTTEAVLEKAKELLLRQNGEEYLTWALQQIGASTVGTTPPEKRAALLAHIKTGLGEA